jgi:hypothetical protein
MKKMINSVVFASLAAAALAYTPAATAQLTREAANGHGTLLSQNEMGKYVRRQFSFSATRQADGTVRGQAQLHNPAFRGENNAPYQLHVDITCMKVVGNIAVMGGTTRRTNDPNLVDAVYFTAQDNGEPGRGNDRLSRAFFFDDDPDTTGDPQACLLTGPTDFPLEPIEAGNIQVRAGTSVQ